MWLIRCVAWPPIERQTWKITRHPITSLPLSARMGGGLAQPYGFLDIKYLPPDASRPWSLPNCSAIRSMAQPLAYYEAGFSFEQPPAKRQRLDSDIGDRLQRVAYPPFHVVESPPKELPAELVEPDLLCFGMVFTTKKQLLPGL